MPETLAQATQTAPVAQPTAQPETKPQAEVAKQPDLVTRVSQVKLPSEPKPQISEPEFDFKEIEAIKDPAAKEQALRAYKSFQKGFNEKYQKLAETTKTLEQLKQEMSTWTPEKVQALTANPDFVKAAQSIIANQTPKATENEYSGMSETEKARVAQLESEISQLKNQSYQQIKNQQDEQLKARYASYDPNQMDIITNEILQGKTQITREHVWKAYDYENAIKRAYELGKQDKQVDNTEKVNSMSFAPASPTANPNDKLEPIKGESDRSFLQRSFLKNLVAKK